MCGRYVSATPVEELASYFAAVPDSELGRAALARYNVPPTEAVLGVVADGPSRRCRPAKACEDDSGEELGEGGAAGQHRHIRAYRWGLVPSWSSDIHSGARAFNARAETVARQPLFRSAFRSRRLIVPATAFYEWRREGRSRQPYVFSRADGAPLAFAGLWETWRRTPDEPWLRTLAVITAAAGPDVSFVHDRQPVVLDPSDVSTWLDPEERDAARLQALLVHSPAGTLASYRVRPLVGSTANDGPQLLEPAAAEQARP